MTKIIQGDRIGRLGRISTGCSAVIFDADRKKLLLTRRTDNGQWCLPSGRMEPGESASEACEREVFEETGLRVQVIKLVGIYSNPNQLIEYPDGNRIQLVSICFEARFISGNLTPSDETTEFGYFTEDEIRVLDLLANHRERVSDAFVQSETSYIR